MAHIASSREAREGNSDPSRVREDQLASGLGWFSIGLGLAEVLAPGPMARLIGVSDSNKTRQLLRAYGVREITAGLGLLTRPRPAGWMWSRVAGDALDLATLVSSMSEGHGDRARTAAATAAVVGVTILDVIGGMKLSTPPPSSGTPEKPADGTVVQTIIVNRSPEEAYGFWHDFANLPKFMTYLDSVEMRGDKQSHWRARGPVGASVEWDAETTADEPNRRIAWKSAQGSTFSNEGSVQFEPAAGDRGTMVRVEMRFLPASAMFASAFRTMMGGDLKRRIKHDLRNFKQMLELGEVTQSDASIHEGMHPAQPEFAAQS